MLCDLVTNAQPYTVLILIYITLFELRIFFFRGNETRENIINTLEYRNNPKVTERRSNSEMNVYA